MQNQGLACLHLHVSCRMSLSAAEAPVLQAEFDKDFGDSAQTKLVMASSKVSREKHHPPVHGAMEGLGRVADWWPEAEGSLEYPGFWPFLCSPGHRVQPGLPFARSFWPVENHQQSLCCTHTPAIYIADFCSCNCLLAHCRGSANATCEGLLVDSMLCSAFNFGLAVSPPVPFMVCRQQNCRCHIAEYTAIKPLTLMDS